MVKQHLRKRGTGWLCTGLVLTAVGVASGQTWTNDTVERAPGLRGGGPPNDLCADATEITKLPFSEGGVDWALATPDIDVSCNAPESTGTDYGFWYTYTPAMDCDAYLAAGAMMMPDMVVAVFTGPDCGTLTEVACSYALDGNSLGLWHTMTGGVTYWILVGGWDDTTPSATVGFYMTCSGGACCVDQDCTMSTPTLCDALGGTYAGDDVLCDANLCLTGACCYADGACTVLEPDDCTTSGGTYLGGSTNCTPNLCPQPAPENDLCTEATEVTVVPFTDPVVNTSLATPDRDMSCDNPDCTEAGFGVWYTYTPSTDCDVSIDVSGQGYAIAVYTGPDCDTLTEVACSPADTLSYTGAADVKYWILVSLWKCYSVPTSNVDIHIDAASGACCLGETCTVTGPASCDAQGGVYAGEGVPCDPSLCLTGACCFGDASCQVSSADDCATAGGTYLGGSTVCDPNPCSLPGDACENPLHIELPLELGYTDANQTTCGRGDDYWSTCLFPYDYGEDIIYELTVTSPVCVDVTVTGNTPDNTYFGMAIHDTCPLGPACIAGGYTDGVDLLVSSLLLHPDTYYMMVDSWPPPDCLTDFTLTVNASTGCAFGACCDDKNGCYEAYEEICLNGGGVFAGDGTVCDPTDCQGNYTPDVCDIAFGWSNDCQGNSVPDECDLSAGASLDGNLNGVPDECDEDCDGNSVPDECELPGGCDMGDCGVAYPAECGSGEDCQENGVLDPCEVSGAVPGMEYAHDDGIREGGTGIPSGVNLVALSKYVVAEDAEMITSVSVAWHSVDDGVPVTVYVWADPTQDSHPGDAYVIGQGATVTANVGTNTFNEAALDAPVIVGPAGTIFYVGFAMYSDQFPIAYDENEFAGYTHWLVGDTKNPVDPDNLGDPSYAPALNNVEATGLFANLMIRAYGVPVGDCDGNGTPDACDVPPICLDGPPLCSLDCNGNLTPDSCEVAHLDCNGNGIPDDCDIAGGASLDCNVNGIPDECDAAECDGRSWCSDCDGNGALDVCDISECDGSPECSDCNRNSIPDGCDIDNCEGEPWCSDCQYDGIPDGCQLGVARGGGGGGGGTVLLIEDFESGVVPPAGWTAVVNNATTWQIYPWDAYEGAYLAFCWMDLAYTGPQDEWLISPELLASGPVTLSGYTQGSILLGVTPYDRFDVEAWLIVGPNPNDDDDTLLGTLDELWLPDSGWGYFAFDFAAPGSPFRIGFRYTGYNGGWVGLDLVTLMGESGVPANDCNGNRVPDECDLCGDLNADTEVDYDDYVIFLDAFGGEADGDPAEDWCCDYDDSGAVGMGDYAAWLQCYRAYIGDPTAGPPEKPWWDKRPGIEPVGGGQGIQKVPSVRP